MLEIDTLNYEPLARDGIALPGREARRHPVPGGSVVGVRVWRGSVDDMRRAALHIGGHGGQHVNWNDSALLRDAGANDQAGKAWHRFYGGISSTDRAALVNDQAATDLVSSLVDSFSGSLPAPESIKMQRHWSDADGELCAGRYFDGADNAFRRWRRDRRVPQAGRIVRVTFNFGGNCDKSTDQLAMTGAAGLALCVLLDRAGYRCELAGMVYIDGTYPRGVYSDVLAYCDIKAAEHPLDIASVASVFASQSLRMCFFPLLYMLGPKGCCAGMGKSITSAPTWANGDIALAASCFDKESVKRAISDALAPYMASAAA